MPKRRATPPPAPPRTRTLTVLGQDPRVLDGDAALTVQVELLAERIEAGPRGARVHVIDYDATTGTLYKPLAYRGRSDPYEHVTDIERLVADPRFHAQNTFGIVCATLARFERGLGRRVPWAFPGGGAYPGAAPGRGHVLKVAPHAFSDANAFYSRRDEGLLFGYFQAEDRTVFTCLSHDIVAHETTHALLDGLRPRFSDPSSPEQAAFHEGFSDVVALLSVFQHPRVVSVALRRRSAAERSRRTSRDDGTVSVDDLTIASLKETLLVGLGEEFGSAQGSTLGALRRSVTLVPPAPSERSDEPHALGELLVAAMMNALLEIWHVRLAPLTAGRRRVDLARVVEEGAKAADHLLAMSIRAIDYTPPVDLHFGDFLSAILTADTELHPTDGIYGYRGILQAWFRAYHFEPSASTVSGGLWAPPTRAVSLARNHFDSMREDPDEVFNFVWENAQALELHPNAYTYIPSVRPSTRVSSDGFSVRENVAEYVQILTIRAGDLRSEGLRRPKGMPADQELRIYGGGVLIFDEFGQLKFHVASGVGSKKQNERLQYLWDSGYYSERRRAQRRFAAAHRRRALRLGSPYPSAR